MIYHVMIASTGVVHPCEIRTGNPVKFTNETTDDEIFSASRNGCKVQVKL